MYCCRESYIHGFIHDGPEESDFEGQSARCAQGPGAQDQFAQDQCAHDQSAQGQSADGQTAEGKSAEGLDEGNASPAGQGSEGQSTAVQEAEGMSAEWWGDERQSTAALGNGDTTRDIDEGTHNGQKLATAQLEQLVDNALKCVIEDLRKSQVKNSVKSYKVTGKFLPKDLKELKETSTIIDRARDGKSGQGADMCQEEFLKKGLSKVAAGKINTFPVFRQVTFANDDDGNLDFYFIFLGMVYVVLTLVRFSKPRL
jgi:hypothetical protein